MPLLTIQAGDERGEEHRARRLLKVMNSQRDLENHVGEQPTLNNAATASEVDELVKKKLDRFNSVPSKRRYR